jgi:hypothetical protein
LAVARSHVESGSACCCGTHLMCAITQDVAAREQRS